MRPPYLLLTFIPLYRRADGALLSDRLWHRDLVRHFEYIPHLRLACPVRDAAEAPDPGDLVAIEVPPGRRLEIAELPWTPSVGRAIALLPRTVRALARGIRDAGVVHSGIVGWPIPLGWIANPIAMAARKPLVIVVESTPWRAERGRSPWRSLRAGITEALGRYFVSRAEVCFFTHEGYRDELGAKRRGRACVTPATWIDEHDVLSTSDAEAAWVRRVLHPPRLLFAARLVPEKGIDVLLEALALLDARGVAACVDIMGAGPRLEACERAARELRTVSLRVRHPVPYGEVFFELLDEYHGALVPLLGDEQPRILFDAFARALPVIGSDAPGIARYVVEGVTGRLHARGDVAGLAESIEWASHSVDELCRMGGTARDRALEHTHRAMHEARARVLREHLGRQGPVIEHPPVAMVHPPARRPRAPRPEPVVDLATEAS